MAEWIEIDCDGCFGDGLVSIYSRDGADILGAGKCGRCGGSGRLFLSDHDRVALYPGGPFRGRMLGRWQKAKEAEAGE